MKSINFESLKENFKGEIFLDKIMRTLYATDASAYREFPLAVVFPKDNKDIKTLIDFANKFQVTLIPRTAGTSLAGQVVGKGIIVDISKTFTKIFEVNKEESWVSLQPSVVRDELNMHLKPQGLFFGPETSTANRAMVGGMVGNNSCGSNSVIYGSARDHLMEVQGFLSDGSFVTFSDISKVDFFEKITVIKEREEHSLEDKVYLNVFESLSVKENQNEIREQFPKRSIPRRNTGYAIDELLETEVFTESSTEKFNFCKLIAGSEGTLMFITEMKLHVNDLPPKFQGVVAVHCNTIDDSLRANLIALKYKPSAVELMDHYILECTKSNKEQMANRFFVEGDPGALLCVEISRDSIEEVKQLAAEMEAEMRAAGYGYHFPVLFGDDIKKVWTLRKAGLGLLSNLPGDEKAVAVIEDTAVDVNDLPEFIIEFNAILAKNGMYSVHYAHASTGELHLRPIINLKTEEGKVQFRMIAEEISTLVKKYKGSLSGEHGDGRLRGEFIKQQIGEKNYALIKDLKKVWDPNNIFNANKIVDTPPMDEFLRYTPGQKTPEFTTMFRFKDQDILQHAEQCNGSGDCRKSHLSGGTMCPSYMATKSEKDTTRARANILRETLTQSDNLNRFDSKEIKEVLDLCLVCKACKSECPSNVDMAKLKMEFTYQYQKVNGVPLRSKMIANYPKMSQLASYVPWGYNLIFKNKPLRKLANSIVGFHPDRTMPLLSDTTLKAWFKKTYGNIAGKGERKVFLFIDEFTNFNDVEIGKKAVQLLVKLGYSVEVPRHVDSGRSYLSKGMLDEAKALANENVELLSNIISENTPLIGIEPSAILTFRDEYPELVSVELAEKAALLAKNALMFDEFIGREIDAKKLDGKNFKSEKRLIKLHGHCQQKAVASMVPTKKMLSLPKGYEVQLIPSGCCGMAGSFGYEKEHYDISMKIGELVLFPTVRQQAEDVIIAAPGTSCRHQIHDGTGKKSLHPIEILFEALV
ncbi:FAD-binding oxidoreductase [Lacihabitans sp. LS3-19]|uniref:FAD-binding and (Fe-S)-binding domain-containing protein n=1 Tax=Lacihabitans sp. LS3-19 TaxID=2487335 RepID=UPI0020CE7539|nr:FAD-binding and (Fe-S)-binding domain-containing protein [Lacihabitans sp. LS3-19]MCP9766682.1 FAD-binding oxidoreductase [Lacihabitans sp. LS3-19]